MTIRVTGGHGCSVIYDNTCIFDSASNRLDKSVAIVCKKEKYSVQYNSVLVHIEIKEKLKGICVAHVYFSRRIHLAAEKLGKKFCTTSPVALLALAYDRF